jgi:NAD(P)-dependent dehydrogenase (short-subunit alcohol dehydrogenase family)
MTRDQPHGRQYLPDPAREGTETVRLTPDDTAAAVAYLASDAAAAMTGQVLCADGGLIMR